MTKRRLTSMLLAVAQAVALGATPRSDGFSVTVELENEVCPAFDASMNEAGIMWPFGNSLIARIGERVFVSAAEIAPGARGYNSLRWSLWEQKGKEWKRGFLDIGRLTREPCPLAVLGGDRLAVSANPALPPADKAWGRSIPTIYDFYPGSLDKPTTREPRWLDAPGFNHHSYRSFAADSAAGTSLLFQHDDTGSLRWALFSGAGQIAQGKIPWYRDEATYESPLDLRICYPAVALSGNAVHFLGVSDIPEPNEAWRAYKFKLTNRTWDYDFRRLFYISSADAATESFSGWMEIASRESTAGNIFPCDIRAEADGRVHLLWFERALDDRLRKDFFPGERQSRALNYALIRSGRVELRSTVAVAQGDEWTRAPGRGRFHATPDGRLFILYSMGDWEKNTMTRTQNWIVELSADGTLGEPKPIPLRYPLGSFYTATTRTGNAPSDIIDLLGENAGTLRYARIRIE